MDYWYAVPNYLRTKLSLELEAKQKERWSEARKSNVTEEQIKSYNKMLSSSLERITELKDEVEEKRTRTGVWSKILASLRSTLGGSYLFLNMPSLWNYL